MNNFSDFLKRTLSASRYAGRIIGIVLLPIILSPGCSTTKEKRLEKESFTLVFRHKSSLGSEIEKMQLDHPIKISEEEVKNHLLSLRYEELSLLGKGRYVYDPNDVRNISRIITKAFNHVSANSVVYFELETPRGTTIAEIFASKTSLNWRFEKIKGVEFDSSFTGMRGATWRLVPKDGQKYYATKNILGKNTQENWIVADLSLSEKAARKIRQVRSPKRPPSKSQRNSASPTPSMKSTDSKELEKKLEILKNWREKNLIDEEEYQRKRKELLDTFL